MRKVIYGILITIVVIGIALSVERSIRVNRGIPAQGSADGKVLPTSISFRNFSSKDLVTFDKFSGKVLLVNFWASWCEACMAEMPSIQKLYDTYKDKGLQILAINVDDNPEKVVPAVVNKLHLTFPVFTDENGALSQSFEVMAIPFSVVADRKHKIVWAESGERDWASDSVLAEIKKLLDEPAEAH